MFEFTFGLTLTLIFAPIFVFSLISFLRFGAVSAVFLGFASVFTIASLGMMIHGLLKVIKDKKTDKYGSACYGMINKIKRTGSSSNGKHEYKAEVNFINPESNELETVWEIIGFDYEKFPIGSFMSCKYYRGDINIISAAYEKEIPEDIKSRLVSSFTGSYEDTDFDDDDDFDFGGD